MSIEQVTGAGHVAVMIKGELKVTEASSVYNKLQNDTPSV
jgi:hypothetical protein